MVFKRGFFALAAATALAAASAQPVMAQSGVKVGVLRCDTGSAVGYVIGSTRQASCVYSSLAGGPSERYIGQINRWGVDLGYIQRGSMVWAVFAPATGVPSGALQGSYGGVGADVAAGAGIGANALIGGLHRSITLQPVNIEGMVGIHVGAGVTSLTLRSVRRAIEMPPVETLPR